MIFWPNTEYLIKLKKSRDILNKKILCKEPIANNWIDIKEHFSVSKEILIDYVTLDEQHITDIIYMSKLVAGYINDATLKRPFNIVLIAEPGSGKSHFMKSFVKSLSNAKIGKQEIDIVPFNMTNVDDKNSLLQPLELVRNLKASDKIPILFLDEFDSSPNNYSLLLPILWDGEYYTSRGQIKLGKMITVIAGSNKDIKDIFENMKKMKSEIYFDKELKKKFNGTKIVDLLSRINGMFLEIPSLDIKNKTRNRLVDKICITISILEKRFGEELTLIPSSLLRFIAFHKFRFGVRSISNIVNNISDGFLHINQLRSQAELLPLTDEHVFFRSTLSNHLITDKSVKDIIKWWNKVGNIFEYVRFKEEPKMNNEI